MLIRSSYKQVLKLVGKNLDEHIKASGLSKMEVCRQANIDKGHMGNLTRGRHGMTLRTILDLCYVLEITPNDLLDYYYPIPKKNVSNHPNIHRV